MVVIVIGGSRRQPVIELAKNPEQLVDQLRDMLALACHFFGPGLLSPCRIGWRQDLRDQQRSDGVGAKPPGLAILPCLHVFEAHGLIVALPDAAAEEAAQRRGKRLPMRLTIPGERGVSADVDPDPQEPGFFSPLV